MRYQKYIRLPGILFGGFLYALGLNQFVVPYQLFSGGVPGLAQLLSIPLGKLLGSGFNVSGLVYWVLNLPLLYLAWKDLGKSFFFRTLLGSGSISLFMSLLPVPTAPLLEEELVSVVLGGLISGAGIGVILILGGCGGGTDILGVWAARRFRGMSVGKLSMGLNVVLYCFLLLYFDLETFVYSLIFMLFFSFALDKTHYQNINVRLMIFTKMDGIDREILSRTGRGVTEWGGIGAFTHEGTHVLITCINKYEYNMFLELVHSIDPAAFVIADENVRISGNFEKRLL